MAKKPKARKPLSEQSDLVGQMAAAWRAEYGFEPSWPKHDVINFHRARARNPGMDDRTYLFAFVEVFLANDYWRGPAHPLWAFTRHIDTQLAAVEVVYGS